MYDPEDDRGSLYQEIKFFLIPLSLLENPVKRMSFVQLKRCAYWGCTVSQSAIKFYFYYTKTLKRTFDITFLCGFTLKMVERTLGLNYNFLPKFEKINNFWHFSKHATAHSPVINIDFHAFLGQKKSCF